MQVSRWLALTLICLASGFADVARAADRVPGVPNFQAETPAYSIHHYILGASCMSLPSGPLDLSCNPASLATEEKRQFRINAAFNDDVAKLNKYRQRLEDDDGAAIVSEVLDSREPIAARATTALWYQRDWWAVGFVPVRGGFGTLARNPAYPEISADVYKEWEVFAKAGLIASEDRHLQAGLQLRYVQRDFFRRKFDLFDGFSDPSQIRIEEQKVLFVEPGVSYSFDGAWASSVSAALTQLPVVQSGTHMNFDPVLDVGFATAPPFLDGHLRTTTHYTDREDLELFSRFIWGAVYDFDRFATVSFGLGKASVAVGLEGHFDSVVLGIGYKTEEIAPDQWQSHRVSTALFEAGLVF